MRKAGPFDDSPFYEVENRRLQRAFNQRTGFVKPGQGAVTAGTGAQLVIAAYPDGALIDGLYVENPASETVTLSTNTGSTSPRIDRLVLRLDMTAKTIEPFQIVGTPAASPTAPALTRTATVFDMPLCQYRFPGSASAQNPGSIVDERVLLPGAGSTVGTATVTTDPGGNFTVTHGIGTTPVAVFLQSRFVGAFGAQELAVTGITSTTFTARAFYNNDPQPSQSFSIYWRAELA